MGPSWAQGPTVGVNSSYGDSAALEIGLEFERVKNRVQRIQLLPSLKVLDSQAGLKQECKRMLKVMSKCARFAETGLKLLS